MRVFLAGASGAVGTRLLPQLIDAGHEVIGTVNSPEKAQRIRAAGAEAVRLDLLDASAVRGAVLEAGPEAIIHQATALSNARWGGSGVMSFIHLDDAAAATVLALQHDGPAIYNVVDDEPAPVREWLPVFAQALGAKPPRHFPTWLARLVAGEAAVMMGTEARGASNVKAKRELGWTLRYPSWRDGFFAVYGRAQNPKAQAGSGTPQG